jgi:uncharacterized protein (TIGR02246 family)
MTMRGKIRLVLGGLVTAAVLWSLAGRDSRPSLARAADEPITKDREADTQAIRKSSEEFAAAFAKADARALAALWTEQGECHDADGTALVGRAAIEKGFAEYFKEHPGARLEVLIHAIRFPAAGLAVEEGVLRQSDSGKQLPSTTLYAVTHVREQGRWKIAVSREWGAGQDRLEDLDWLIGTWKASLPDVEMSLTFRRDPQKPYLLGEFSKKEKGKTAASGSMRIALDPQRGQLHSWSFEDDGGHGESLWLRDGNHWVLDSVGVQADGSESAAVNLLTRLGPDAFTWRSIDRVLAGREMPDTAPVKLTRQKDGKS